MMYPILDATFSPRELREKTKRACVFAMSIVHVVSMWYLVHCVWPGN